MKTTIEVTGQLNGNRALVNSISCNDRKNLPYGGYVLTFDTKKEAKKALWEAFKYMRANDMTSRLQYSKYGWLTYDASEARIQDK